MINPEAGWPDFAERLELARHECVHARTLNERLMYWSEFVSRVTPPGAGHDDGASFSGDAE